MPVYLIGSPPKCGKTKNDETFLKIAEMIAIYSGYFESEANKYGFPIFEMDNNFEGQLNRAAEYLHSSL